jgi:hypothetical protein
MSTALDVIRRTMRLLNINAVGDPINHEEASEMLETLNLMIDRWNMDGTLCYRVSNETFTLTANTASYTIGVGGVLNTTRPIRIETAFTRVASGSGSVMDYPMKEFQNEEYEVIPNKGVTCYYPTNYMYNPTYPLGTL